MAPSSATLSSLPRLPFGSTFAHDAKSGGSSWPPHASEWCVRTPTHAPLLALTHHSGRSSAHTQRRCCCGGESACRDPPLAGGCRRRTSARGLLTPATPRLQVVGATVPANRHAGGVWNESSNASSWPAHRIINQTVGSPGPKMVVLRDETAAEIPGLASLPSAPGSLFAFRVGKTLRPVTSPLGMQMGTMVHAVPGEASETLTTGTPAHTSVPRGRWGGVSPRAAQNLHSCPRCLRRLPFPSPEPETPDMRPPCPLLCRQRGAVRGISVPVRHARRAWHRRAVRLHAKLCRALRRPPGREPRTATGGGGAHACGDGGGGGRDAGGAGGSGEVAGRVRVLWGACGLRCARRRALRRRTPRRRALRLHARRGTARSYASGSSFQVPSGRHASALRLFCQLPDSEPRVWRRRASTALPLMATTSSGRGGCAVRRASLWCLPLRPLPGVGGGVIACS